MKNLSIFMTMLLCMVASSAMAQDFSDNFEVRRMDTRHFHLWDQDPTIVNMGTRGMTIMAKGETPADANVVYFDATDSVWEAEAILILSPKAEGGLVLMQSRNAYWGVTATTSTIYVRNGNEVVETAKNTFGRCIHLRLNFAKGKLTVAAAAAKGVEVVKNANPTEKRYPAQKVKEIATLEVSNATRITFTAAKQDVVSVRDFWYTKK